MTDIQTVKENINSSLKSVSVSFDTSGPHDGDSIVYGQRRDQELTPPAVNLMWASNFPVGNLENCPEGKHRITLLVDIITKDEKSGNTILDAIITHLQDNSIDSAHWHNWDVRQLFNDRIENYKQRLTLEFSYIR